MQLCSRNVHSEYMCEPAVAVTVLFRIHTSFKVNDRNVALATMGTFGPVPMVRLNCSKTLFRLTSLFNLSTTSVLLLKVL